MIERMIRECCKSRDQRRPKITVDRSNTRFIESQLVVYKRPEVSEFEFDEWKRSNLLMYRDLKRKALCEGCDSSLELWEGANVATFISEKVARSGTSNTEAPPSGGGDEVAWFSYNLIIDLPEPGICVPDDEKEYQVPAPEPIENGPPLIIAVLDTGIIPQIKAHYTQFVPSCKPGGNRGWNFSADTSDTNDDHPSQHGTVVSKFIIDQANKYRKQSINILPVKVHNKNGKGDLFSILCAFVYAAKCGANIINASFGFYGSKGSRAPQILVEFVKKHLLDNNILMVAAAGNVNADHSIGNTAADDIRDLNRHPFFPASLAGTFNNVIAVTTVSNEDNLVSPSQNHSSAIVDVGVACDMKIDNDYRFQHPLGRPTFVLGSSFATPIITGIIAQHCSDLVRTGPGTRIDKNQLFQRLRTITIINENPLLAASVRDGNVAIK